MGKWVNRRFTTWLGWTITMIMMIAGGAAIFSLFS
jgi:Mn2+/Fe2+ NRAMP family transporter